MSSMLLSLLIKVRTEGQAAIAQIRDGLQKSADRLWLVDAATLAFGTGAIVAARETMNLAAAIGRAKDRGRELFGTLVHGSLGAAAGFYAFKKGFLDIAVEADNARGRLKALEGTDGRAESAMAWTEAFRAQTAFALGDVRNAWIELREHAVRPTEYTMTAVADAASAMGVKMAATAQMFGEAVQGHASGRLRELGVEIKDGTKAANTMAITYRYLGKEITETVSKGNRLLVANKLAEILTKLHGGAAAADAKGWSGLLLTMAESWRRFALDVMDKGGVFETLTAELNGFLDAGGKDAGGLSRNARSLAEALKEIIRAGFAAVGFLRDNLGPALDLVGSFVAAIGGWKVALGGIVAFLAAPFVASIVGVLVTLGSLVSTIVTVLVPAFAGMAITLVAQLLPALTAFGVALLSTPIGLIAGLIATAVAAAWWLYENWDSVAAFLGATWEAMKTRAAQAWGALREVAATAAAGLMEKWEAVRAFFAGLWSDIRAGFDAAFGWIGAGIDKVKGLLPSLPKLPALDGGGAMTGMARDPVTGAIEITVKSADGTQAAVTGKRTSGPLAIDAFLGQALAMP